jgi:hypothetical protein
VCVVGRSVKPKSSTRSCTYLYRDTSRKLYIRPESKNYINSHVYSPLTIPYLIYDVYINNIQAYTPSQNNMLILQESCIDTSGSLVVYCPVDLPAINIAMNGEDPSYIPLLPSGFIITTDGHNEIKSEGNTSGASTSKTTSDPTSEHGTTSTGSLVTVVFQIQVSSLPSAKMSPESLATVNNLITNTVHQIKASFNGCSTST